MPRFDFVSWPAKYKPKNECVFEIPVIEQSKSKAETKYAAPGTDVVFVT